MKSNTVFPSAPVGDKTIQQRITEQCTVMLEEIRPIMPEDGSIDIETPVVTALALLRLDARKHFLHQHDLLRMVYLQGVLQGAALYTEHVKSKLLIE